MLGKCLDFRMLISGLDMISSHLIEAIRACAKDFGVKSVWLFGSALGDEDKATDIDLAVEGLVPEKFFDFYGRLFFADIWGRHTYFS